MTCGLAGSRRDEAGFVLVGVTMFILVLTILGLSLFSLSGFEGQFMIRSMNYNRAFNAAAGGLERARFALTSTNQLMSVKANYMDGVDYAVAVQNFDPAADDTSGAIQSNGDPVWVRVRGRAGDATVVLQARIATGDEEDYYKRLLTARQISITNKSQVYLSGDVAQQYGTDTTWNTPHLSTPSDGPPYRSPIDVRNPLALASLTSYYNAHQGVAAWVDISGGSGNYKLNAAFPYQYFKSPPDAAGQWNITDNQPGPNIEVNGGTAIWLLKAPSVGCMQFLNRVTISGTGRLVIAALTWQDIQDIQSIEFQGGINASIPVIIVTPGIVAIEADTNQPSFASYLSIYAGRVNITGPSGSESHFHHPPSRFDVPDVLMDVLYGLNILPNASVGSAAMTFEPGFWSVLSESTN